MNINVLKTVRIALILWSFSFLQAQYRSDVQIYSNMYEYQNNLIDWNYKLTTSVLTDFECDETGNIWLLTDEGLIVNQVQKNGFRIPFHTFQFFDRLGIALPPRAKQTLPQATCLKKDDAGNMWIGTKNGLLCFDGSIFHEIPITDDLPFNRIKEIAIEPTDKSIWVIGEEVVEKFMKIELIKEKSGIARFDGERWVSMTGEGNAVPSFGLHGLVFCKDGSAWMIGGREEGLFRYKDQHWTNFRDEKSGLPALHFFALAVNPQNDEVYAAWEQGVWRYDGSKWKAHAELGNIGGITALHFDDKNTLWIGTQKNGLYQLNNGILTHFDQSNFPLVNDTISMIKSYGGYTWLVQPHIPETHLDAMSGKTIKSQTFGGVVGVKIELEPVKMDCRVYSRFNSRYLFDSSSVIHPLEGDSVIHVEQDSIIRHHGQALENVVENKDKDKYFGFLIGNSGEQFVVTKKQGLSKVMEGRLEVLIPNEKNVFNKDIAESLMAKDGTIWMASLNDGVLKCSGNQVAVLNKENSNLPKNMVYTLLLDKQDRLWAGTDKGVCRLEGNQFVTYNDGNSDLPHNEVYALCEDSQGTLYIGTKKGLATMKNGTISKSVLYKTKITQLACDSNDRIWIGTPSDGLYRFDGANLEDMKSLRMNYRQINQIRISKDGKSIWLVASNPSIDLPYFTSSEGIENARYESKAVYPNAKDDEILKKHAAAKEKLDLLTLRAGHEKKLLQQLKHTIPYDITLIVNN